MPVLEFVLSQLTRLVPAFLFLWLVHPLCDGKCNCSVKSLWRMEACFTIWLPVLLVLLAFFDNRYDLWIMHTLGGLRLQLLQLAFRLNSTLLHSLSLSTNASRALFRIGYTYYYGLRTLCKFIFFEARVFGTRLGSTSVITQATLRVVSASLKDTVERISRLPQYGDLEAFLRSYGWTTPTAELLKHGSRILLPKVAKFLCPFKIKCPVIVLANALTISRLLLVAGRRLRLYMASGDNNTTLVTASKLEEAECLVHQHSLSASRGTANLTLLCNHLDVFRDYLVRHHGLVDWDTYPLTVFDFDPYDSSSPSLTDNDRPSRLFMRFDLLTQHMQHIRYLELVVEFVPTHLSPTVLEDCDGDLRRLGVQVHALRMKQSDTGDATEWDYVWQWDTPLAARFVNAEENHTEDTQLVDVISPEAFPVVPGFEDFGNTSAHIELAEEDNVRSNVVPLLLPQASYNAAEEPIAVKSPLEDPLSKNVHMEEAAVDPEPSRDLPTLVQPSGVPQTSLASVVDEHQREAVSPDPVHIPLPPSVFKTPSIATPLVGEQQPDVTVSEHSHIPLPPPPCSASPAAAFLTSPNPAKSTKPYVSSSCRGNKNDPPEEKKAKAPSRTALETKAVKADHGGTRRGAQRWRPKMKQLAKEAGVQGAVKREKETTKAARPSSG